MIANSSLILHRFRTTPGAKVDESGKLVKPPKWQPSLLDLRVQVRKFAGVFYTVDLVASWQKAERRVQDLVACAMSCSSAAPSEKAPTTLFPASAWYRGLAAIAPPGRSRRVSRTGPWGMPTR